MSAKWLRTVPVMSIWRNSTPSSAQSTSAFERVRFVVPKQGMVTASTSAAGRPSRCIARTATSRARQESSPPEMPITALLAWTCSSRRARPAACMVRICSHRPARSGPSGGRNGAGETGLVSTVSQGASEKGTVV